MSDIAVEIYSTPTCPECNAAKEFLSQHDIPYEVHDIENEPDQIEKLRELTGKNIVPTIKVGDEIYIGFMNNREQIEKLLLS